MKATKAGHGNLEHKYELAAPRESHNEIDGHCIHCKKPYYGGPYGIWNDGGTCSFSCEKEQAAKPRFLPKLHLVEE